MGYGPSLADVVVDTREHPKCSGTGITRLIKKVAFLNQWRGSFDWRTSSASPPFGAANATAT
jgi:hypothetical protein